MAGRCPAILIQAGVERLKWQIDVPVSFAAVRHSHRKRRDVP
jgi:hypothetical protein